MTDQELFKALIERGLLKNEDAEVIIKDSVYAKRSPEELLYERRLADEIKVAEIKSELTGAPLKRVNAEELSSDLLSVIPKETSFAYKIIPLERTRDMLVVGMFRPDDSRAREALRFIAKQLGVSLGVYLVTPSDLQAVWRKYSPFTNEIEAAVREIGASERDDQAVSLDEGIAGEDAPVIKIVSSTLRQAVELGASDVHIEPQRLRVRVRFRIDGKLQEGASFPSSLSQPVISRVKVLAKLKLDETRMPQDGRFRTSLLGRDVDFRVATFPTPSGEKVAIRVLDPTTGLKNFSQLGLGDYNSRLLDDATSRPFGMILISGPTGSGKTTTLYSIMKKFNKDDTNILSLEDPVEYFIDGVNQSQVKPEIGYDFASGLRQILRQDPDVIMVGEIRDEETARLAVNAALTGHIMLSTIHTNNAIGVIPRLADLHVPPYLLSSALNLMMAQRLVLQLCSKCKKEEKALPEAARYIEETLKNLPDEVKQKNTFKAPYTIYKAAPNPSCDVCKGKGTSGRVAILEIFRMTRELGELINSGFSEGKLQDEARRQGMLTLRQDGVLKALEGKISIEEVMRETI